MLHNDREDAASCTTTVPNGEDGGASSTSGVFSPTEGTAATAAAADGHTAQHEESPSEHSREEASPAHNRNSSRRSSDRRRDVNDGVSVRPSAVRLMIAGATAPVAPTDTLREQAVDPPHAPPHRVDPPSSPTPQEEDRAEEPGAAPPSEQGSIEPTVIDLDLRVEMASVKSILGHYFGLFLLMLIPAILLLIGIILPFWLQEMTAVVRFHTVFPFRYSKEGRELLRGYAGYAPCLVFRAWYCGVATLEGQHDVTQQWALRASWHLQPLLKRLMERRSVYVPDSCERDGRSPITGAVAPILVRSHNAHAPHGAELAFAVSCSSDEHLLPMVNITTAIVSLDVVQAALPVDGASVGPVVVGGNDIVNGAVLTSHEYDMNLSTCADFLTACSSFGYRFVWIPSPDDGPGMGFIHLCRGEDNASAAASSLPLPSSSSLPTLSPAASTAVSLTRVADGPHAARTVANGDYTTVVVCSETVYEAETANRSNATALSVEATLWLRYYGQLGGIRFKGLEVLSSMGLILPVIIFIVTEVLLAVASLMIIMVGYTLPVQRFQLRQLRTAVVIDANILADAVTQRMSEVLEAPQQAASAEAVPNAPVSPATPATADETFLSREGTTATTAGEPGPSRLRDQTEEGEEGQEMASWPYGRGQYLVTSEGGGGSASEARVGGSEAAEEHVGDDVLFSPAEAPSSSPSLGRRPSLHHSRGRSHITPPQVMRTSTLSSPAGVASSASPAGSAPSVAATPTVPATPSTVRRRRLGAGDAAARRGSRRGGGGQATSTETSPLVAISNAALAHDASDAVETTDGAADVAPLPSYEAIARAARETMLRERTNQAKLIRALLFIQQGCILLAFIVAVVELVFVLAGVGNAVGRPCAYKPYEYCTYTRRPRAQHVTLTSLALVFMVALIGFQLSIIRKRIW